MLRGIADIRAFSHQPDAGAFRLADAFNLLGLGRVRNLSYIDY